MTDEQLNEFIAKAEVAYKNAASAIGEMKEDLFGEALRIKTVPFLSLRSSIGLNMRKAKRAVRRQENTISLIKKKAIKAVLSDPDKPPANLTKDMIIDVPVGDTTLYKEIDTLSKLEYIYEVLTTAFENLDKALMLGQTLLSYDKMEMKNVSNGM